MSQGLLAFLDADPYYHERVWAALLDRNAGGGNKASLLPLQSLLSDLMLRRRVEDVGELGILPGLLPVVLRMALLGMATRLLSDSCCASLSNAEVEGS